PAMYLALLLPVLGLLDIYFMRYAPVSDHWQYVALPVILAAVVGGIAHWSSTKWPWKARVAAGVLVLVIAGAMTWRAQAPYQNEETLWRETLRANPKAYLAWNNLGVVHERAGDLKAAETHYRN